MHRALFVCGQNRLRSPTAERIFSSLPGIDCASAGVHESADVPLDPELLAWADTVYVMEQVHRRRIQTKFRTVLNGKRIVVIIPTFNELSTLPVIVSRVRASVPEAEILVADDHSPDGKGRLADELAAPDDHVQVIHRLGKEGLRDGPGSAHLWARGRVP